MRWSFVRGAREVAPVSKKETNQWFEEAAGVPPGG